MSIKKNAINNLILQVSGIVMPLITFPYVTRTLSVKGYGTITFIDAFTQYFLIFATLGIPYYGVREISKRRKSAIGVSKIVKELIILNGFFSLLYSAIFLLLCFAIPVLKDNVIIVIMGCGVLVANAFTIEWYYQGMEKFAYITKRSIALRIIYAASILLFIKKESDFVLFAALTCAMAIINAIVNFSYFFTSSVRVKRQFKFVHALRHMKPLLVLFSINVSISIYTVLDTIILGLFTTPERVSLYVVPLKLVKMFWMLIGSLGIVLIPKITDLYIRKEYESITSLLQKSMNIVFLIALPFCFYCLLFPTEILTLISGQRYLEATGVLRTLAAVPLIIGLCNVFGTQFLLPIGFEKKILHATIIGLVISIVFNLLLDHYLKEMGAAVTCVMAESAVCIYVYIAATKKIKLVPDFSLLIHIAISLLVCFTCFIFFKNKLQPIIALVTSVIIYVASFFGLQFLYFKNSFVYSLLKLKPQK